MKRLTKTETKILRLLSQHRDYPSTCSELGLTRSSLYVHLWRIRKKTGLPAHQAPKECRTILDAQRWQPSKDGPTVKQMEVMRLFSEGKNAAEVATIMGEKGHPRSSQTMLNAFSQACKRAGIVGLIGTRKLAAIREYLEQHETHPAEPPPQEDTNRVTPEDMGFSDPAFL